jgi:hypothetical protein
MQIILEVPAASRTATLPFIIAVAAGAPVTWRELRTDRTPKQRIKPQWNAVEDIHVTSVAVQLTPQEQQLYGADLQDIPKAEVTKK